MVDVELYGGRGGFLEHVRARTLYALGAYRSVNEIKWTTVERLAFVCKGNICRSPYACARARSLGVEAVSFGLEAVDGAPADAVASQNALLRGMDLSAHRSRRMNSSCLTARDLVIVFEPQQITEVRRRIGDDAPAGLLGVWSRPVRPHIQDPYGMSGRYFQQCFSVIDASVAALVEHMARAGAAAITGRLLETPSDKAAQRNRYDGTLG
jgi:protein-tyrosine phosphatase